MGWPSPWNGWGAWCTSKRPRSAIEPGDVRTDRGTVRAEIVVRATEGYTVGLEWQERALLPLGNYMIATEPLDDALWRDLGLANREVFEVMVPMVSYGQRTADGRIALGGLGAPYRWRSGSRRRR